MIELEVPHHTRTRKEGEMEKEDADDNYCYWWGGIDAVTAAPILTQPYHIQHRRYDHIISYHIISPRSHVIHIHTATYTVMHTQIVGSYYIKL